MQNYHHPLQTRKTQSTLLTALSCHEQNYSAIHGKTLHVAVQFSWNVMAHGDAREGNWRGNWRMVWVASTLHTTSEHGVSSITTADAHNSAASSRLNWRPRRFKWTRPFCRKMKSNFCACAITFQTPTTEKHRDSTAAPWRDPAVCERYLPTTAPAYLKTDVTNTLTHSGLGRNWYTPLSETGTAGRKQ